MKKWIVGSTIAAAAIASVFFFSTYSLGTTRYVINGASGGCVNAGTNYNPTNNNCSGGGSSVVYTSIANALVAGTTVAGDTLYVRAGNYAVGIHSNNHLIPTGTSFANAPVIAAYSGETVTIPTIGLAAPSGQGQAEIKYLILDGFKVVSPNGVTPIGFWGAANHVRIQNCEGSGATGIESGLGFQPGPGGGGFNEIINVKIHNNGDCSYAGCSSGAVGHGVYVGSFNNLFDGLEVYSNGHLGLQFYSDKVNTSNNIIRNSYFHNNGAFYTTSGAGVIIGGGSNNEVYNNIFSDEHDGVQICCSGPGGSPTGTKIYNNTFYSNSDIAIEIQGGSGHFVRNNLFYQNGSTISGSSTNSNNITATSNPFTSVPTNFHLVAGSQAINAGCATSQCTTELTAVLTTDKDAIARGAVPWDVGAYEFDTGGGTPSMTISSPTSGAQWPTGSPQTITWSCPVGCGGTGVDIDLDRTNDTVFEESIANDTPNDGSFSWTVTGAASTTARIRIRDSDATPTATTAFEITATSGGSGNPIISNNTSGTKTGTIPGVSDTWLWEAATTTNENSDTGINVNKYEAGGHRHQLIKFDGLSQVPVGSTITSATLGIYVTGGGTATAQTWDVRRLLRNWDKTQATWSLFSTGNSWATAGGLGALDRVSTASGQMTGITITPGFFTVTSTSTAAGTLLDDVIKIVNGTNPNYGWHIERNGAGNDNAYRDAYSSEGSSSQGPYLELVYSVAAATIVVTEPKAGDLFLSGQTGPVRWGSTGISGNVNIDLSRDGGTTWESLATNVGFNQADVTVTYNAPTSSNCKVRVVWANDSSVVGTSSAFRIGGTRAGFTLVP